MKCGLASPVMAMNTTFSRQACSMDRKLTKPVVLPHVTLLPASSRELLPVALRASTSELLLTSHIRR